jgi:hypothetical protein
LLCKSYLGQAHNERLLKEIIAERANNKHLERQLRLESSQTVSAPGCRMCQCARACPACGCVHFFRVCVEYSWAHVCGVCMHVCATCVYVRVFVCVAVSVRAGCTCPCSKATVCRFVTCVRAHVCI